MIGQETKITREDLYKKVWQTPVDVLAKEFGISGRGLKKICVRLGVPTPARGYWAKLNAGKPVVKYRLPPIDANTETAAWISPTPEKKEPEPPEPISEPVQNRIEQDLSSPRMIQVPKTLRNPHWLIGRWIDEDRRRQRENQREWSLRNQVSFNINNLFGRCRSIVPNKTR